MAGLIYEALKKEGFSPKKVGQSRSRPNVIVHYGKSRFRKSLVFNGHMDTVIPTKSYKTNPFSGSVRGNKMYGLGVLDMKASLSAYVFALKAIKDLDLDLCGRLTAQFVVDEEPGGCSDFGTKHLLSKDSRYKAAIVAEPGPQIGIGHRGGYRFKITTFGEAVHTGVSAWQKKERGRNAVSDMMQLVKLLEKLEIPHKNSKVFPGKKPMLTFPTLIEGGSAINIVPDKCVAYGDVRLMPGNSNRQIRMLIEEKLSKIDGVKYKLEDLLYAPAVEIDKEEEIVRFLVDGYKKVTKKPPHVEGIGPWNDAWMFHEHGIPAVTQVPIKGGGSHESQEWVDLTSVKRLTEILVRVAVSYLCSDGNSLTS
ncbi:M20 family metallopeptidase [Patescibacteria group bacterium]